MNIFDLAYKELEREGLLNAENESLLALDRAVIIRKYLDDLEERKEKSRFKKIS